MKRIKKTVNTNQNLSSKIFLKTIKNHQFEQVFGQKNLNMLPEAIDVNLAIDVKRLAMNKRNKILLKQTLLETKTTR